MAYIGNHTTAPRCPMLEASLRFHSAGPRTLYCISGVPIVGCLRNHSFGSSVARAPIHPSATEVSSDLAGDRSPRPRCPPRSGFYFLYSLNRPQHLCLSSCCSLRGIARGCVRVHRIREPERKCNQRQKAGQELDEGTGRSRLLHSLCIIQREKPAHRAGFFYRPLTVCE